MNKKTDLLSLIAAAAAVVALALWFVSFSTYPAAAVNSAAGSVSGICAAALLLLCGVGVVQGRLRGSLILAAGVCCLIFLYYFVMGRVSIAADAYFIPVNHPAEEDTAMAQTIAGYGALLAAFLVNTVNAFRAK